MRVSGKKVYPNPAKRTYFDKEFEAYERALVRSTFLKSVQCSLDKQDYEPAFMEKRMSATGTTSLTADSPFKMHGLPYYGEQ